MLILHVHLPPFLPPSLPASTPSPFQVRDLVDSSNLQEGVHDTPKGRCVSLCQGLALLTSDDVSVVDTLVAALHAANGDNDVFLDREVDVTVAW
jgi:hypothetical protein